MITGMLACWALSPTVEAMQTAAASVTVTPPANPVTQETLQTYFEEIHYGSWLRGMWASGYAGQKKELPAWYPPAVWDEIVKAELNMDLAVVALPVYQKYMSEEAAQHAIKLFATDEGQKMAAQMFAGQEQARAAGENANDAYTQALLQERAVEDGKVRQMVATVSPEDRREMMTFLHSAEWKQVQANASLIARELNDAETAKQKEIMHTMTELHRDELIAARKAYAAQHGGASQ
jgi:hypothetical protein